MLKIIKINMEDLNFKKEREVQAKLYKTNEENLKICGERIRQGKLVAFPTETVYGLGADATNEEAVLSIFEAKGRPLTDPVIVHIASKDMVDRILLDSEERQLIHYLGSKLWPGPLTLIGPCDTSFIPPLVGSNTGTVGVRWPNNPVAQQLILEAERPIAAPSANRFMHVSPTKYSHVFYDLYDKDVAILEGEQTDLGVESTVCRVMKLDDGRLKAFVLRPGTLEAKEIRAVLDESEEYKGVEVEIKKKNKSVEESENSVAPGQLLKHYSPNVDCKLIAREQELVEGGGQELVGGVDWGKIALIDFNGGYSELESKVALYKDLSPTGDYKEALHSLYLFLRECEIFEGVEQILVFYSNLGYKEGEYGFTLFDKIFRSASGQILLYKDGQLYA